MQWARDLNAGQAAITEDDGDGSQPSLNGLLVHSAHSSGFYYRLSLSRPFNGFCPIILFIVSQRLQLVEFKTNGIYLLSNAK